MNAAYSSKLQCCFDEWQVIADGELVLILPEGNCCDMTGAIEIAEKIMPSVWRISTYVAGKKDTEYRLECGKWSAYTLIIPPNFRAQSAPLLPKVSPAQPESEEHSDDNSH